MGTIECDKSTVAFDVGIAQCDNEIVKCEKKIRVQLNTAKVRSYVMLVLSNVNNETVKHEKKIKVPQNMRKVQSNMILVLFNEIMKPSNVRKKIREPPDVRKKNFKYHKM